ncbi:unnamed protein product [Thlaspi arvense]|uniref:F-box domain-containing protein n=1 Tax=Thlaspi arvense TaxID=13288 RepID=A0AAU9R6J8_THLAR|nr:unnamed protein product [Thlaspi arvense]
MDLSSKQKKRSQSREIQIPMDVVTEVLTRLPAKSLMRFKCVSKLWASLIRSQYFTSRFQMVSSQRLYMSLSNHSEGPNPNPIILSSAPHATTPSSFVVNHNLTIPRRICNYNPQYIRGFMCSSYNSSIPRIYNPATRQLVTLPDISSTYWSPECNDTLYCFGHDPVHDQYKVICSRFLTTRRKTEQWVLVLKRGASWKKASPALVDFCPVYYRPGLTINGVIYYLGMPYYTAHVTYSYVVVSFDIGSEEFKTIQVPGKCIVENAFLVEYGRKLAFLDLTSLHAKGTMDLWVLEDAENKEWSSKALVLQPSQLHLVNNIDFTVNGTTQSGKVVLIPRDLKIPSGLIFSFYILCYDLQRNDMRKIDIQGIPEHWFSKKTRVSIEMMFMDQSESIVDLGDLY